MIEPGERRINDTWTIFWIFEESMRKKRAEHDRTGAITQLGTAGISPVSDRFFAGKVAWNQRFARFAQAADLTGGLTISQAAASKDSKVRGKTTKFTAIQP